MTLDTVSIITALLLCSQAFAQSALQPFVSAETASCLKRSVIIYTSNASTYIVTDVGSFVSSAPSSCPAATTLPAVTSYVGSNFTVTAAAHALTFTSTVPGDNLTVTRIDPGSTITVFEQTSSGALAAASSAPAQVVIADSGFENGTSNPFNTSTTPDTKTSAAVVQGGPLWPESGSNYLLISFNDSNTPTRRSTRRQSFTPLIYNVTQAFAANAGTPYTLSADAIEAASNSGSATDCDITICADDTCGPSSPLTTAYIQYSYVYTPISVENSTVATFSISCPDSAYVGLDNVAVVLSATGSNTSGALTTTITQYATTTITQNQTFTESQMQTQTQVVAVEQDFTTVVSTTAYVTATEQVAAMDNKTAVSTSTTTITTTVTLNVTASQYGASLVYETETATATSLVTLTALSVSVSSMPPGTFTTTDGTTIFVTTTQPGATPPASTDTQTNNYTFTPGPSTAFVTLSPVTQFVTLSPEISFITLAPETLTFTPTPNTETITPGPITYTNTLAAVTETEIPAAVTATPPAATSVGVPTSVETSLLYSTIYITQIQTTYISVTLPAVMLTDDPPTDTYTPPAVTETDYAPTEAYSPPPVTTTDWPPATTVTDYPAATTVTDYPAVTTVTDYPAATTITDFSPATTITATYTAPACTPSVYSTDDNVQWQIQCDTDHIGGDMTNVVTTDLLDCVIACDNYGPACLGVAWVAAGEEQTTCFLKSAITDPDTPTPPLSVDAAIRLYYTTTTTTTTTSTPASAITLTPAVPPNPAVPLVALASPTAIAGSLQGSPDDYDDVVWPVTLPFAIGVYEQTSSTVQVSSNGALGITPLDTEYYNYALPYYNNGYFGDTVILPMWDDLYIYEGTQQGIYYEIDGTAPSRTVTFEYYLSHFADADQYYHFLVHFFEAKPNVVTFQYLNVSDFGASATVGIESETANNYVQHSFNQPVMYPGLQITYDPSTNTWITNDPGDSSAPTTADTDTWT